MYTLGNVVRFESHSDEVRLPQLASFVYLWLIGHYSKSSCRLDTSTRFVCTSATEVRRTRSLSLLRENSTTILSYSLMKPWLSGYHGLGRICRSLLPCSFLPHNAYHPHPHTYAVPNIIAYPMVQRPPIFCSTRRLIDLLYELHCGHEVHQCPRMGNVVRDW